jgi:hypothetical protein
MGFLSESGFSGLEDLQDEFICLNQDFQDYEDVQDGFLSESGFPGFEDVQDGLFV